MDWAGARVRLSAMVAASSRPVLTDDEVGLLLDGVKVVDLYGLAPVDPGWAPTFDLDAAALEGWRWKAGQVAGDFAFSADDASYSKGDVIAHCERMIAMYAGRVMGSAQTSWNWDRLGRTVVNG